MAKNGITYIEVEDAAEKIVASGENPTIEKIRLELGSGSNTTISKHFQAWKKQSPSNNELKDKATTPSKVLAAVDSVWQQIREQADAEIESFKAESQLQINIAEERAVTALEEKQKLNQQYIDLENSYHAVLAEKEILTLDFRQLRDEHQLLQERYDGLVNRYNDMQDMTNQQLNTTRSAHQNEIARLEQGVEQLKVAHQKLIDEIKEQNEAARQKQMMVIEELKVDRLKQEKSIAVLQASLNKENTKSATLTKELESVIKEHDLVVKHWTDQNTKWDVFNNKIFVSEEVVNKLNNLPEMEKTMAQFNHRLIVELDSKFLALTKDLKQSMAQMETEDE